MAPVSTLCAAEQYKMMDIPYHLGWFQRLCYNVCSKWMLHSNREVLQEETLCKQHQCHGTQAELQTNYWWNSLEEHRQKAWVPSVFTEVTENHFRQQIPLCILLTKNALPHLEAPCSALLVCPSIYPGIAEPQRKQWANVPLFLQKE